MVHIRVDKTNFTAGEISPRLFGRGDLTAYANGAKELRNVFIQPTGGVTRRDGLRFLDTLRGDGRLIAFEFNTQQVYLLVFTNLKMDIYRDGVNIADIDVPWTIDQIRQINWTQSADTLLIVHPDVPPKKITRTSDNDWSVNDWTFFTENARIYQPMHKYADDETTLGASGVEGAVTLTASADHFVADHVGTRFRLQNKEVEITAVASATSATAVVKETLVGAKATKDFEEQAFSAARGYPIAVCFHQDRLVIGGSRNLPNRLWLSKSADLFNFDLGEGLDDEAIEFALLSDQVNAIRYVFSGRHLQVFTSGAEWMVTGDPLTPGTVQLNRQTRIGSPVDRTVPPRNVDGATLFVQREGFGLREFIYSDVEQGYQSNDVAILSRHVGSIPVDQDYDQANRFFHIVMANGGLSTLTVFRAEKVTAWSRQITDGDFKSVAVANELSYVIVERNGRCLLERFDPDLKVDAGLSGAEKTGKTTWSGLSHLEGLETRIMADGAIRENITVKGGAVALAEAARDIQIGLAFSHVIEPLPPSASGGRSAGPGMKYRPISITFRLKDSSALRLDSGRGYSDISFRKFGHGLLDRAVPVFTGDKKIRTIGWRRDGIDRLWRIEDDAPMPFTLLSVTSEISVNG